MKGEKVFLRAVEPTDLEIMFIWENDTNNWLVSNTANPFSKHILEQYVFTAHDLFKDRQARFIVCSLEDGEAAGAIDLFELDPIHRRAGLGILIDSQYRGKGLASDALQVLVRHCFENLGLHQLHCGVVADNTSSRRLFENNGFQPCGVRKEWLWQEEQWKDELLYQLIAG